MITFKNGFCINNSLHELYLIATVRNINVMREAAVNRISQIIFFSVHINYKTSVYDSQSSFMQLGDCQVDFLGYILHIGINI